MKTIIQNQRKERDELMARTYLSRHTRYDTDTLLSSNMIKLITGPRRVGKSVFALLMLRGRNFAYLNFDDKPLPDRWDEELVMAMLDEVYPGYEYLLLDEVQNLPAWELWVSKLYRRGRNLVITGSNANMLSSEMATVLTGRYLQVEMLPFSLAETLEWSHAELPKDKSDLSAELVTRIDDYLRNGGYPETISARSMTRNYMATLFDSILLKDVARRHNVRNTASLYNMAAYLLANFCNPFTANKLAEDLELASVTTARKYCDYLHEPYLFFYLPRFNNKLKLMKKAAQKVYVVDNGFVQGAAFNLSDNLGRLLENQVFVELVRRGYEPGKTLFYYRSRNDREIDFVTRRGPHPENLIQVCYDMATDKARRRETDALIECAGELDCHNLTIVTNNQNETIEKDGHTIKVIPITEF